MPGLILSGTIFIVVVKLCQYCCQFILFNSYPVAILQLLLDTSQQFVAKAVRYDYELMTLKQCIVGIKLR